MSDEAGIADAFERRDALERRRGVLDDEIGELKRRVQAARRDAGKEEAAALEAEHGDDFMDWAGKGFMGGLFSWAPLVVIALVVALATSDGCGPRKEHWRGSVLRSRHPEMPVASLCEVAVRALRAEDRCRVSVRCGPGEGFLVLRESAPCEWETRDAGDDSTYTSLVVRDEQGPLWLDEGRGLGRIGPEGAPEVEILLHDFSAEDTR